MNVVIITPTRNEAPYIRITLECMVKQTLLPKRWIIVNDGSTDNTEQIIQEFKERFSFIEYIRCDDRGYRMPGKGVVETFYNGMKRIGSMDYDIVAKLDADLEFPPDTLERVCNAFINDPQLGITGGVLCEQLIKEGPFRKTYSPKGYVTGPNKFYRRRCFEDIGGLIFRAGWDGVDIIRAKMKAWKTGEIESLLIHHLKAAGTSKGEGLQKACEKYGDISYYMGGYFWYFMLRVIGRSIETGKIDVGCFMIRGYLSSFRNKKQREPAQFRIFLKKEQIQHIMRLLLKIVHL